MVLFGTVRANGAVIGPLIILAIGLVSGAARLRARRLSLAQAPTPVAQLPGQLLANMAMAIAFYLHGGWRKARMDVAPRADEPIEEAEGTLRAGRAAESGRLARHPREGGGPAHSAVAEAADSRFRGNDDRGAACPLPSRTCACAAAGRARGCARCSPSTGCTRAISSGRCSSAKGRIARSRSARFPASAAGASTARRPGRAKPPTLGIPCVALFPNTPERAAHRRCARRRSTPTI